MNWDAIGDTSCLLFAVGLFLTLSGYSLPSNIRRWVELTLKGVGIVQMLAAVICLATAIMMH
jgi:hypothetical protein